MADYLTYADIYGQVQNLIDDDDSDTLTVIKEIINNVYRDIIGEFRKGKSIPRWLTDYDDALDTVAATRTTTLTGANNVERVLSVSVDNQPCLPITMEELELGSHEGVRNKSAKYWWDTSSTSRPTRYYHEKKYDAAGAEVNKLYWFVLPDAAYDIRYWYEKRVSPLSADANVPLLPPFAHPALVLGSLAQAEMFDIRAKNGPWDVLYEGVIAQLRGFTNNFVLSGYTEPWGQ